MLALFLAASIPPEVYGGAGLAALLTIAGFLLKVSNYQAKSLKSLITALGDRIEELEAENRQQRLHQRWCEWRISELLRVHKANPGILIPPSFYQDDPPVGEWPVLVSASGGRSV